MTNVDTIIHARWIAPMDHGAARLLEHHAVAIADGRIQAVGTSAEITAGFTASGISGKNCMPNRMETP